ncbi:MAG: hypothetical protein RLO54_33315, partial [Sandaracinaceae bacterium]
LAARLRAPSAHTQARDAKHPAQRRQVVAREALEHALRERARLREALESAAPPAPEPETEE